MRFDRPAQRLDAQATHRYVLDERQSQVRRAGKKDRQPERRQLGKIAVLQQQDVQEIVTRVGGRNEQLRPRPSFGVGDHR